MKNPPLSTKLDDPADFLLSEFTYFREIHFP